MKSIDRTQPSLWRRMASYRQAYLLMVPFLVVLPKSRQISCAVFTLSGWYGTMVL